ncbi:MAG: multicopper oxidase domain-containing protein [Ectothiorhodospiraceae bacterium]|nr:multicopper oxidase domain-containing protein [Ectothiorhodospiraceae bacterium]
MTKSKHSVLKRRVFAFLMCVTLSSTAFGATREYFVAAEDIVWDYAPSGQNLVNCMGQPAPCAIPQPWTNSHTFNKTRYTEYTDATFTTKKVQPQWLGILGPVIRAEVGDLVIVHFCNNSATGALGMHPHGFRYTKDNEGADYYGVNAGTAPGTGAQVAPGACFDYQWHADKSSGPAKGDLSSKVWWYHSHINEPAETNAGLLGPIIITRKGQAKPDGSPKEVDQEFVAAFFIFDELGGAEPGLMHSINGYIFGNLKGFIVNNEDKVRWHVLGMGNEVDLHTPHWHGKTVTVGAKDVATRTDVVNLLPATMITADMKADNPGEWVFHCHVSDHILAGMSTTYQILP